MRKVLWLLLILSTHLTISQIDSSDVFIIGDKTSEPNTDTLVINDNDITHALKFDVGRIWSEVYLMSFEHLIKNSRWALEYEASFDMETETFWYDWYTNYKFTEPENNVINYNSGFSWSFIYVAGIGVNLKKYLSVKKRGIYGLYVALKLKERLGHVSVKSREVFGVYDKIEFIGNMNLIEIAPTIGYCFYLWDLVLIEPLAGPSGILTIMKYPTFEENQSDAYWKAHRGVRFSPAFHFGLRISYPKLNLSTINWSSLYVPF